MYFEIKIERREENVQKNSLFGSETYSHVNAFSHMWPATGASAKLCSTLTPQRALAKKIKFIDLSNLEPIGGFTFES